MLVKAILAGLASVVLVGALFVMPALAKPSAATPGFGYGGERPGWGFGDENHDHSGPPGLIKKGDH